MSGGPIFNEEASMGLNYEKEGHIMKVGMNRSFRERTTEERKRERR
jgi:hypothetical protein